MSKSGTLENASGLLGPAEAAAWAGFLSRLRDAVLSGFTDFLDNGSARSVFDSR